MKKFLVIGNPIDHSLSPKLHNYWIKNNNIKAIYEKQKLENSQIKDKVKLIFDNKDKSQLRGGEDIEYSLKYMKYKIKYH